MVNYEKMRPSNVKIIHINYVPIHWTLWAEFVAPSEPKVRPEVGQVCEYMYFTFISHFGSLYPHLYFTFRIILRIDLF